jgi:flagellar motor switch protein FliN
MSTDAGEDVVPIEAVVLDGQLAEATAAARAAAAVLPAAAPLTAGTPSRDPGTLRLAGQAVCARFSGAVQGEVVAIVAQDLVDALKASPLGELDLAQAVRPALEAAAGSYGPVVVDPANLMEPEVALTALAAKGDAVYVPLLDGGAVQAAIAVVITARANVAGEAAFVADPVNPLTNPLPPPPAGALTANARPGGLDLLHHVELEVSAELGRTRMTVRELLSLTPGAIVELDRAAGSPADLLVNGRLVACGEVVVVDENFGLRITEINPGTP